MKFEFPFMVFMMLPTFVQTWLDGTRVIKGEDTSICTGDDEEQIPSKGNARKLFFAQTGPFQ